MISKHLLINTNIIFYEDMFSSNSKSNHRKAENLIDINKLINTSEIFYEDMLNQR